MELCEIQCPSCFEWFLFTVDEVLDGSCVEFDYDCEVCCSPMLVVVAEGGVFCKSLDEL